MLKQYSVLSNQFRRVLFLLVCCLVMFQHVHSQGTQTTFGQNRVQFHDFEWSYYDSENFTVYFYPGGQNLGKYVILFTEEELKKVEARLDYRMSGRIDILIYNDITDLAQTNLGLGTEFFNTGGTTKILGNKIFVHFDGNHEHLYRAVMEGIGSLFIDAMMFGGSFQEILQNAVLLNLPTWFKDGLAAYVANDWNTDIDDELRRYFASKPNANFGDLAHRNQLLAGHALWYYVGEVYGRDKIQNILYLSRINRSAENGFFYELGVGLDEIILDWNEYFSERYAKEIANKNVFDGREALKVKMRRKRNISVAKISPDGKYYAYAVQDDGKFRVRIAGLEEKFNKKILRAGFRSDNYPHDESYPIIAWSPAGTKVGVIYEKRDEVKILEYDLEEELKVKDQIRNFQKIHSFEYINPVKIVLSGQEAGQTDIYTYQLNNPKAVRYTNDPFDDRHPVVHKQGDEQFILWSSNRYLDTLITERLDSVLPIGNFDLFLMNMDRSKKDILRLTHTKFGNEYQPRSSNGIYTYLSDESGILNQYRGFVDSFFVQKDTLVFEKGVSYKNVDLSVRDTLVVDSIKIVDAYDAAGINVSTTDLPFNLRGHDHGLRTDKQLLLIDNKRHNSLFLESKDDTKLSSLKYSHYRRNWKEPDAVDEKISDKQLIIPSERFDTIYEGDFAYTFSNKYDIELEREEVEEVSVNRNVPRLPNTVKSVNRSFRSSKIIPYRAKFSSDYVVTQLDNSIMTHAYDNFNLNGPSFNFPDLSAMLTYGLSDLMEDHKIIAGFRIPTNFNGTEVFVSYTNLKKRIDKRLLVYRNSDEVLSPLTQFTNVSNPSQQILGLSRIKTYFVESSFSYPLDVIRSVRLHVGYRNDKNTFLTDGEVGQVAPGNPTFPLPPNTQFVPGLFEDDFVQNWLSGKLEYVHDDSRMLATNIPEGLRFKTFFEYYRNLNEKNSNLFNIGWDVRHYLKIFKTIIWANRFAGASSWGDRKIVYYLGGVDSWIVSKFDTDIPVDINAGYAFQATATNIRGQKSNVRNGNSYVLWNSEFRIPIFSALSKKTLKSNFLRDFQLVAFFDAGAAYKGLTPFDEDNPFTQDIIGNAPVEVEVNYYRNPTVAGYGAGIRSSLLGYFVRLDIGWGIDGAADRQKPIWHFSLAKDF